MTICDCVHMSMYFYCWPADGALLSREKCKSMHIEKELKPHKACGRGEEKPAVFDCRAGTVANHILYVVIETFSTYGRRDNGHIMEIYVSA